MQFKIKILMMGFLLAGIIAEINAQPIRTVPGKKVTQPVKTTVKTPVKPKTVVVEKNKDTGGDGLVDYVDNCPIEYGSRYNNGCPADPAPIENPIDKYSFKGTTYWKNNSYYSERFTIVHSGLCDVSRIGIPYFSDGLQNNMKPRYIRVAPDKFKSQLHSEVCDSLFLIFTSPNLIVRKIYKNNEVKSYTYSLIASYTADSLPQATNESITAAEANGIWAFENWGGCLKVKMKGDLINFRLINCQDELVIWKEYTAKKTSTNTYEFKSKDYPGMGRLVYINPTRICLSFVNKEYVSVGYYNK